MQIITQISGLVEKFQPAQMISRELRYFLLIGALTVLSDYLTYSALSWHLKMSIGASKGAGFIVGAVLAYIANRFWTFGSRPHSRGSLMRFSLLYVFSLVINIAVNELALALLISFEAVVPLAFLIATLISATINFIGMKFFVFKVALT